VCALVRPPLTPPFLFLLFAACLASLQLLETANSFSTETSGSLFTGLLLLALHGSYITVAGLLPLKPYKPGLNVAGPDDVGVVSMYVKPQELIPVLQIPSATKTCPEDNVNLWEWNTFTFVEPIIRLASKRRLGELDVWSLSPFFSHKNIFTKCLEWRRRLVVFHLARNGLNRTLQKPYTLSFEVSLRVKFS